jgi:hypothetical protein
VVVCVSHEGDDGGGGFERVAALAERDNDELFHHSHAIQLCV